MDSEFKRKIVEHVGDFAHTVRMSRDYQIVRNMLLCCRTLVESRPVQCAWLEEALIGLDALVLDCLSPGKAAER